MVKVSKEKIKIILTVVGWVVIIFAVIALAMFIVRSGVF